MESSTCDGNSEVGFCDCWYLGYIIVFVSRSEPLRKYLIGRSCKNDEFDWSFDLVTVTWKCHPLTYIYIYIYNIAFVNSERWLAKSRVDITICQHGKFPGTLLLKFFVLYYKRNIKHFSRIDIQLYQHSWKLEKLEIVWKHSALRASCFHTISRFSNFHECWYNCISIREKCFIFLKYIYTSQTLSFF